MRQDMIGQNMAIEGQVALGFRAHSGWAVLVTLRDPVAAPAVIQRRRVELADRGISGSVQPYHAAEKMKLQEAEAFLAHCAETTQAMAQTAVRDAVAEVMAKGYKIAGACVLLGSGRATVELAAILASHAMIHTAEGNFYRVALRTACERGGLALWDIKEKELRNHAATRLGLSTDALERRVSEVGKTIGPPWRQDEKLCAMASWCIIASTGQATAERERMASI